MNPNGNDLYGWQLNNPDQDAFDVEIMEVFGECVDCERADECTFPCEAVRRLVPKEGRIVALGHKKDGIDPGISYFAHLNHDDVKFIVLRTPDYLWATASYVAQEHVPAWALSQLDQWKE
jgi:hypothetical protein